MTELEQAQTEIKRLKKEAQWLADKLSIFCGDMMWCAQCPLHPFDCTKKK